MEQVIEFSDEGATIKTDRLDLIPLVRGHADLLYAVLSDQSLYEHTHEAPPASLSALRERYSLLESRRSPDGTEAWLNWLLRESEEAIGYVQATVAVGGAQSDVAWVVGVPWQRRGYATEAADAVVTWLRSRGVRAFRAKIHPRHSASRRVAVKVGFSPTEELVDGEEVWNLVAS